MAMPRRSKATSAGLLAFAALLAGTGKLPAQAASQALAGKVTAEQGALEGVLVSARRAGSTVTVTVVSDKDGRYVWIAALPPGGFFGERAGEPVVRGPARDSF
jgi:hypothetical protein